ncbi:hypothetical protein NMY22_g18143 [Coprinellus aureogranulatus]|nr:hypothetical protein NMY22_g18143 [Coprinellus aureogranulatus]
MSLQSLSDGEHDQWPGRPTGFPVSNPHSDSGFTQAGPLLLLLRDGTNDVPGQNEEQGEAEAEDEDEDEDLDDTQREDPHTHSASSSHLNHDRPLLSPSASSEPKFTIREMEEIYLARRSREIAIEVGNREEELGRYLSLCVRVLNILDTLNKEAFVVRDRQAVISNGASRYRAFEYEWEMQQKVTVFNSQASSSDSRRFHQPSLTPLSRKLRIVGHSFYICPSLTSGPFNRLWNRLFARP